METIHLLNVIIWLTQNLPQNTISILAEFYIVQNLLEIVLYNMVLALQINSPANWLTPVW